jgi:hypothetical protein
MSTDNVVPFTRIRSGARSSRGPSHAYDPDELLRILRGTKRLEKHDQAILVENLGQLIVQFYPDNAKAIARSILEDNERDKRKRYIRIPGERVGPLTRHAGSGGSFARIIERLIELRVSENFSRDQAKGEIVRKALWRTSFRPPAPFRMPANPNEADVAQFAADMQAISDRLADETDLAEFFALLAKHPIFPDDAWYQWTHALELKTDHEPNSVYDWGWDTDEYEISEWIPWWAPRCLIGYWYIPFTCRCVRVPEDKVAEIHALQLGEPERYRNNYFDVIEPFITPQHIAETRLLHRLPVWLIILPLPNKLVPCLYAAIHHPGGFYPSQKYPLTDNSLHPFFVASIGTTVEEDAVYLPEADDDEYDTFYVLASPTDIGATGTRVDHSTANLRCDLLFASMPDELPEWLEEQPVQRFLKLTPDSHAAMSFALASRSFVNRQGEGADGTIFRPAFPDAESPYTGLRHDTIAAYLLRDFVKAEGSSVFAALTKDALAKRDAAQGILSEAISDFRKTFQQRIESKAPDRPGTAVLTPQPDE